MAVGLDDRFALLKQVSLFRGLSEARLRAIAAKLGERYCDPGETIFRRGQAAEEVFLIHRGRVRISGSEENPLSTELGAGSFFGGEALSAGASYRADALAQERTTLLIFYNEDAGLLPSILVPERVAFLRQIHLFQDLGDDQLEAVAGELEEQVFEKGETIVKEGEEGDRLFLIYDGQVRVTQEKTGKSLAKLTTWDYFGEEALLRRRHRRTATVTTLEKTSTLALTRQHFRQLLRQAPSLYKNFAVAVNSHRLARRLHFKWLQPDEVIFFLARKHSVLLAQALVTSALLALLAAVSMFVSYWYSPIWNDLVVNLLWYSGIGIALTAAILGLWKAIDWGNDYYIVTDRRAVRLEKVIGIYDSRDESPLSAIQRINVETKLTGQILDYGDLIIRTIVGSTLTFEDVAHPYQAAALIEEHWRRAKEVSRRLEEEEMRRLLRERLTLGQPVVRARPISSIVAKPQGKRRDYHKGHRTLGNLFRMRFEQQTTVTYRKHVLVLFLQTWKPIFVTFFLIGVLILVFLFRLSLSPLTLIVWVGLIVAGFLWWLYEYIDWSNDIFQVTPDQILDIDKTPLGRVTSDIAALENILSIEYKRVGPLELLFNYGTVYITVGGGKQMAFEDVYNPSAVQEDIERRRLERAARQEEQRARQERERLADWFAAYYHEREAAREEENADKAGEEKSAPDGESLKSEVQ